MENMHSSLNGRKCFILMMVIYHPSAGQYIPWHLLHQFEEYWWEQEIAQIYHGKKRKKERKKERKKIKRKMVNSQ